MNRYRSILASLAFGLLLPALALAGGGVVKRAPESPSAICQECEPGDPEPPPLPARDSSYISQSVPTSMVAGQSYAVSVQLRNTGTNTWTSAGNYNLGSQNPIDNGTWGLGRAGLVGSVLNNQVATIAFTVVAPSTPGNYNFQWRMVQDGVAWFGATTPNVVVTVTAPANVAPSVALTAPASGEIFEVGQTVTISATATDADGSVQRVEFQMDGVYAGQDTVAPYSLAWTATQGTHSITAKAFDNVGAQATSAARTINVYAVPPPTPPPTPPPPSPPVTPTSFSRTDLITYHDNKMKWVLGQVASSTTAGLVESATEYDSVYAQPITISSFGKVRQRLTYDTTSLVATGQRGTVSSVSDNRDAAGFDTTIAFSQWKGGIPQLIAYPGGATKSALVDDFGQLVHVIDETHAKTCYEYDTMGRVSRITYPSDTQDDTCNESKWFATTVSYTSTGNTSAYGMPANHWRQTTTAGFYRKVLVLDSLWRPVVEQTMDLSVPSTTMREVVRRYDSDNRVTFESFAMNTQGAAVWSDVALKGTATLYDILGRVKQVRQDSELGVLATTTAYITGLKSQTTNPRGKITTTAYMAYDQPAAQWPVNIVQPAGSITDIARDPFGKPLSITRRDATNSLQAVRTYGYYQIGQELCRISEPESLSTYMDYDEAGNLKWSATGYPIANGCALSASVAARRSDREYDPRNRLTSQTFADGYGNTIWTYGADALPVSAKVDNLVTTNYTYNRRRMLIGEQLVWGSIDWSVGYDYDRNGGLLAQWMPGNLVVDYAPNALGQPTKAGTFATGVTYYPNGGIDSFTYGNGVIHKMDQNARKLPMRSRDYYGTTAVIDDSYDYDANGNVVATSDGATAGFSNRNMIYDNQDRLTTMTSAILGGTNAIYYSYDVLDNFVSVSAQGRSQRYCYEDGTNRLTTLRAGAAVPCSTGAAMVAFAYDLQGNWKTKNNVTYDFGQNNRLRGTTGGVVSSYVYDAAGRRVRDYTLDGARYQLFTQAGQIAFMQNARGSASTNTNYIYLNGSLVAERSYPVGTTNFTTTYQHTDALGTPAAVTNSAKTVTQRDYYEPFGRPLRPFRDDVGFTGHLEDAATELNYMQQRYYDPTVGRFASVDPVGTSTADGANFNRYKYALNSPYNYTDPDGRCESISTCQMMWDDLAVANGTMSRQELMTRMNARGWGAIGGLTFWGATVGPQAPFVQRGLISGGVEIGFQTTSQMALDGKSLSEVQIDKSDVAVASAVGSLAPGIFSTAKTTFQEAKAVNALRQQVGATAKRAAKLRGRLNAHLKNAADAVTSWISLTVTTFFGKKVVNGEEGEREKEKRAK